MSDADILLEARNNYASDSYLSGSLTENGSFCAVGHVLREQLLEQGFTEEEIIEYLQTAQEWAYNEVFNNRLVKLCNESVKELYYDKRHIRELWELNDGPLYQAATAKEQVLDLFDYTIKKLKDGE